MDFQRLLVLCFLLLQVDLYGQSTGNPQLNWSIQNPLEQKVFIENNKGQFDKQAIGSEKIYYKATLKGVDIYFTDNGILYTHIEKTKGSTEKERKNTDPDRIPIKLVRHTAQFQWKGVNTSMRFIPEDEVSFYYTYSSGIKHTIIAHAFKKLLCRNLYPGIDVEYSFPGSENSLLCTFYLHSGADSANVRLLYNGTISSSLNATTSISIKNDVGDFTLAEHVATISINSKEQNDEIWVPVKAASTSSVWITNPGFNGYDGLYDLCYDDSGNVYVYGGAGPFQLAKINSTGNLQWIYTANFPLDTLSDYFYGDFVTDKTTGTSYLAQALNDSVSGPEILKINTSGIVTGSIYMGPGMSETWRMDMNYCTHQIIIGGGGVQSKAQAALIDTSLTGLMEFNVLGATTTKNDVNLLTCDRKEPYCYLSTAWPNVQPIYFGNLLIQCPIPALEPPNFMKYDGYNFTEIFSNEYVNVQPAYQGIEQMANGINGIVATANNVYLWDGYTLSSFNKNTGSLINTLNIHTVENGIYGQEVVTCSGIDADYCENIYLGDQANIDLVDTSFNRTGVISMPSPGDTVYDLHISPQGNLYVCGYGFVASYFMPQSATTINKVTSPACSGCNGTAYVSLSGCETGTFSWSNGTTGQVATNLCAGTYTVSAQVDCSTIISDTVIIQPSPNPSVTIPGSDVKEVSCFNENNGSAIALASGGTPPYTYMWYPSNIPNDTIINLSPGTYTFIVTDIHGCASIDTVTISQPSLLGVSASVSGTIESGQIATLTATASGGTPPYTYTWSDSANGTAINVTPSNTTTYTVIVTDNNGCTSTAAVTVDVLCGDVFIPTAFSPNGDGHDDYLYVRGDCITDMSFLVFDRWGNKVFESTGLLNGWDGKYKGQPMNVGSYVWYLKATLKDGTKIEKKGNVTLVR